MLTLKYRLSEEEFFDYNYFTVWSSPDKKGYRLKYYLRVFILYAAVAAIYIAVNHKSQILFNLLIFSIIGGVYLLIVPFLIKKSIQRRVKDILSKSENNHVLDESEVVFTDTGIIDKDKNTESKYDWEAIIRKSETAKYYYLYTNSYHAIVIPKRVLTTQEDKVTLDRILMQNLSLSSEF